MSTVLSFYCFDSLPKAHSSVDLDFFASMASAAQQLPRKGLALAETCSRTFGDLSAQLRKRRAHS